MSEWVLHCAVNQPHIRRSQPTREAALAVEITRGNADWQRDLSASHERIGIVLWAQGNLPAALDSYQAEHAIRERLAALDPGNAEARAADWDFNNWCHASGYDASDPDARRMFECLLAYARREGRAGLH